MGQSPSDRASYRNRGGVPQRLISAFKSKKYLTKAGNEIVIKHNTEFWLTDNAVLIGNDVWIGAGVKILNGSHIGDGAVIGSNAIVTRDIPANAIAVGVPARVIKYRT